MRVACFPRERRVPGVVPLHDGQSLDRRVQMLCLLCVTASDPNSAVTRRAEDILKKQARSATAFL